ncbi:MAG: hypothetical protein FJZ95_11260 [Chloroflexi bacterium]|nr:hypothetical protein [Chloroflexota bacterium]
MAEKQQGGGMTQLLGFAGAGSFLIGYIICVIAGIWWPDNGGFALALFIMGLIVGFLNITGREVMPYLIAAIALVVVGTASPGVFSPLNDVWDGMGTNLNDVVRMMANFTAPAAIVQAVRAGISLAKPGD